MARDVERGPSLVSEILGKRNHIKRKIGWVIGDDPNHRDLTDRWSRDWIKIKVRKVYMERGLRKDEDEKIWTAHTKAKA